MIPSPFADVNFGTLTHYLHERFTYIPVEEISLVASNNQTGKGIIADYMGGETLGACEAGLWNTMKLGETSVSLCDFPGIYQMGHAI